MRDGRIDALLNTLATHSDACMNPISEELRHRTGILVYGAGKGGKYTQMLLEVAKLPLTAFVDKNANDGQCVNGIPVYKPEDQNLDALISEDTLAIISIGDAKVFNAIEQLLKTLGIKHIISYMDLFNEVFLSVKGIPKRNLKPWDYLQFRDDILAAYDLFKDSTSKEVFIGFLQGHILNKRELFCQPTVDPQYFPTDIGRSLRYDRIIDCGAGRGDFIRALMTTNEAVSTLALFEPDKENYNALLAYMNDDARLSRGTQLLWPCAVGNQNGSLAFFESGTAGSHVSSTGNTDVLGVRIEDVLRGYNATLLKMDIEGSEYEAIMGAEKLIKTDFPDIAICVYHDVSHIWAIPLLLAHYCPEYCFALRTHHYFGMATILYAYRE